MTDQTMPQASSQSTPVPSIRSEAEWCSVSLPVGIFGVDDALIAIEIIYYAFQLWHSCSGASSPEAAKMVASSAMPADESDHLRQIQFRHARRQVRRSVKKNNYEMSQDRLNDLTRSMLYHVQNNIEPADLAACCAEPMIQDEVDD